MAKRTQEFNVKLSVRRDVVGPRTITARMLRSDHAEGQRTP
jgi:hypothetical protein